MQEGTSSHGTNLQFEQMKDTFGMHVQVVLSLMNVFCIYFNLCEFLQRPFTSGFTPCFTILILSLTSLHGNKYEEKLPTIDAKYSIH